MAKRKHNSNRPALWADGGQNPPFDPRAFLRASLSFARDSMSGLLTRCAASALDASAVVGTGRWKVPAHRLGRSGRYLPHHQTVAHSIAAGGGLLHSAGRVVSAQPDPAMAGASLFEQPLPDRFAAFEPPVAAVEPAAPVVAAPTDDADLQAIRALLGDAVEAPAPRPSRPARLEARPAPQPAAPAPQQTGWRREWLAETSAKLLGYGLLAVSLPYGAVKALMAHLNGEDLRKLGQDA